MAHELYKKAKVFAVDIDYQETADGDLTTYLFEFSKDRKFVRIRYMSDAHGLRIADIPLQVLRTFMRAASA